MFKKPIILSKSFFAKPEETLMDDFGDLAKSRTDFLKNRPTNLSFLLNKRYSWMNNFIKTGEKGIEVGCGNGLTKEFIFRNYILTDLIENSWVDQIVDALDMPYEDSSFDFIISCNVIHHLAYPYKFLNECSRVLKNNGELLIAETNASFMQRLVLRIMKYEGYSYEVDPFDINSICNDPNDPWSGNASIPNLLFDDIQKFEQHFPFKLIYNKFTEFLILPISGGVVAKKKTINLPTWSLKIIDTIDKFLITASKNIFSFQRQIVLLNKKEIN